MSYEQYPWYSLVNEEFLNQGDLLNECPVLIPNYEELKETESVDFEENLSAELSAYNVVVMSQSCDLEHDKLDIVLVCPHWPISKFCEQMEHLKTTKGKKELKKGSLPSYHVLNKCEIEEWKFEPQVVDFRNVFGIPKEYIKDRIKSSPQRIRLMPPYREHLSQAFARFFMRVGLPVNVEI